MRCVLSFLLKASEGSNPLRDWELSEPLDPEPCDIKASAANEEGTQEVGQQQLRGKKDEFPTSLPSIQQFTKERYCRDT